MSKKEIGFTDTLKLRTDSTSQISLLKKFFLYKAQSIKKSKKEIEIDFGFGPNKWEEKNNLIVLTGPLNKHYFQKQVKTNSDINIDEINKNIHGPESTLEQINPNLLVGKWFVYKRINTENKKINRQTMISSISFEQKESVIGNAKMVSGGPDTECSVSLNSNGNIILTPKNQQNSLLKVFKQSEDELILEDESGIRYFLKKE
ncbi:MAG TPA: hypothetical protein PKX92_07310 [Edaphocola sp.]|nr:hypothetical protein [Edaphocola sp.]